MSRKIRLKASTPDNTKSNEISALVCGIDINIS
jgi:hypothetical protein